MPLLYHELWKQNQSIKGETMTVRERMLRMKSRPKASYDPSPPLTPPHPPLPLIPPCAIPPH